MNLKSEKLLTFKTGEDKRYGCVQLTNKSSMYIVLDSR